MKLNLPSNTKPKADLQVFQSADLAATQALGALLFEQLDFPACIYLQGTLGAGKTSLCQAIVNAAGYSGVVTSPTYNLIHEYAVPGGIIYHMDLYRLDDPSELEYLGLADLWQSNSLFLIEWPDKGEGFLPPPDYQITIQPKLPKEQGSTPIREVKFWRNL